MNLLAIDPGPIESAYVLFNVPAGAPLGWAKLPNPELLTVLRDWLRDWPAHPLSFGPLSPAASSLRAHMRGRGVGMLAVEMIASYGMPVGAEVFDTCVWIGRFVEAFDGDFRLIPRPDVKLHLTGQRRAKDANIRQALIDRFGPGKDQAIGRKASPGPLYGITGDVWSALAVAITAAEQL